ncbi:MAG: hypothetical protein WCK73_14550 [Deltaproteobacteria bacterium]
MTDAEILKAVHEGKSIIVITPEVQAQLDRIKAIPIDEESIVAKAFREVEAERLAKQGT